MVTIKCKRSVVYVTTIKKHENTEGQFVRIIKKITFVYIVNIRLKKEIFIKNLQNIILENKKEDS